MKTENKSCLIKRAACAVLSLTLLTFCGCVAKKSDKNSSSEKPPKELSGSLTISADAEYQNAVERIIQRIDNTLPGISFSFSNDNPDIFVTDRISPSVSTNCLPLNDLAERKKDLLIRELLVTQNDDIIGLPLFLKVQSYWYDSLYYQSNKLDPPYSAERFNEVFKNAEYAAVYDSNDPQALFWGHIAPVYLSSGGTEEELSIGKFNKNALTTAFNSIYELLKKGAVTAKSNARQLYQSEKVMFWLTDISKISAILADLPLNTSNSLAPGIPFYEKQTPRLILRSAFIAVNNKADKVLVNAFLEELYDNNTLINSIKSSKIPFACRVSYENNSIPDLISSLNNVLAFPNIDIAYIDCRWDDGLLSLMNSTIVALANRSITTAQAVNMVIG